MAVMSTTTIMNKKTGVTSVIYGEEMTAPIALEKTAEGTTHVFWLFNWGYDPVHRALQLVPRYQRCDISKDSLTIHDTETTVVITLADIERYDLYLFYEGAGSGHTTNLRLFLPKGIPKAGSKRKREVKQLFYLPLMSLIINQMAIGN